jgi:hypothetical protein
MGVDDGRLEELTPSPLYLAAISYAESGWKVLPLHTPGPDGTCSCLRLGCPDVGKHPRTEHGVKAATTDLETILQWWTWWPQANIGIATGSTSGIVVIDIDGDRGGIESWQEFQDMHGRVETLTSKTGAGLHLYLICPSGVWLKSISNGIGVGIDVKAEGGYVVAPPSIHWNGNRYRWEADEY